MSIHFTTCSFHLKVLEQSLVELIVSGCGVASRDFSTFMPNEGALQKAKKYLRQRRGRRSTRRSSASLDGSVTGESVISRASSAGVYLISNPLNLT